MVPATTNDAKTAPAVVSVVIACHNMARYVAEAVASVLAQSYPHLEVLVIDDGSSDDPRAALASLMADPRVQFLRIPQSGQSRAKNTGIAAATGTYVAFLDADDLWTPDKLERQLPLFANPRVGVVYSDHVNIDAAGRPLPTVCADPHTGNVTNALFVENFITGMTAIVRRECFERVGMFDESIPMGIDYDLWLRISVHYEFEHLARPTYLYRMWGGQMSRKFEQRLHWAIHIMRRFLEHHPGVVPAAVQHEAWLHTYTYGGDAFGRQGQPLYAVKWLSRALWLEPTYWPAWRQLAALPIREYRRFRRKVTA